MTQAEISNILTGLMAPKILKRVPFKWVALGFAAYYGLKLLSKKSSTNPAHTEDFIDVGSNMKKK